MNHKRLKRWVEASQCLAKIEAFMVPIVQYLGRLDIKLIEGDKKFLSLSLKERGTIDESSKLTDRFTLSYLWILGVYELIRTLTQRSKNNNLWDENLVQEIENFKRTIARLRMPLAKMEPAKKHKNTDSAIAYPYIHKRNGISWRVSQSKYIPRKEISENFLLLLERIKKNLTTQSNEWRYDP